MTNAKFQIQEIFHIKKVYGKPFKAYQAGNIPYVTGKQADNGCIGHVCAPATDISKGNCISVDPITGLCCYQPIDFVGRGFSGASINLLYNEKMDDVNALYFCAAIQKRASATAAYTNLFNSDKLATAMITLPVIPSSDPSHTYTPADIDWQYMRDRIKELERDRIKELDAYLKATGLDDYELTEEDKKVLSLSEKSASDENGTVDDDCGIRKKEFLMSEIFDIHTPAKKFNANTVHFGGRYPYVARGSSNNGIRGYINEDTQYLNAKRTFSFGQDTATVYFQTEPYFTGDKIKILELRACAPSDETAEYLICAVKKAFSGFSWGQASFNENVLNNTKICLPITPSGEPDWDYMEKYIRAMEKVVIADVVKWKNREIEATKKMVEKIA